MPRDLTPLGDVIARYSARDIPTGKIRQLRDQTMREVEAGETSPVDALLIMRLLLCIACEKLGVFEESRDLKVSA